MEKTLKPIGILEHTNSDFRTVKNHYENSNTLLFSFSKVYERYLIQSTIRLIVIVMNQRLGRYFAVWKSGSKRKI